MTSTSSSTLMMLSLMFDLKAMVVASIYRDLHGLCAHLLQLVVWLRVGNGLISVQREVEAALLPGLQQGWQNEEGALVWQQLLLQANFLQVNVGTRGSNHIRCLHLTRQARLRV